MHVPACTAMLALAAAAAAQSPPTGFSYQLLTDNQLNLASAMAFAPDGRLFLCERTTGNIRVFKDGALQTTPWATVPTLNNSGSEQGLLGIAVDPGFLQNRYVYVYYTTTDQQQNRIARLQEVAGAGSNFTILSPNNAIPTGGSSIHNGGRLVFGQDGMLYAGTGDHGQSSLAQQTTNWNGKVLRFTVPNLGIPVDNPFAGSPIWSYGHRNQFGLTVHPITGDVFQTENGNTATDEVNRIVRGGNYGWPQYEGSEPVPDPSTVDPLWTWSPPVALTGTCFYSGANYPASYTNAWFVVDFNQGRVRKLDLNAAASAVVAQTVFDDLGVALDIQMGPDGNLWVLHNDSTSARGGDELGRYVHAGEPVPSANLMAVSNRIVGGSLTFGFHGHNGDLFLPWASAAVFTSPQATPYGNQWVPIDIVLPFLAVTADDRVYLGLSVANHPALIGTPVYTQALRVDPTTLQLTATNYDGLVLR